MGSIVQGTPIISQGSSSLPPATGFYSLETAQNPVLPGGRAQGGSIIQGTPFTLPEAFDAAASTTAAQPLVPISTFGGGGSITRGTPVNRTLAAGSGGEEEDMETDENETPTSMDQVFDWWITKWIQSSVNHTMMIDSGALGSEYQKLHPE